MSENKQRMKEREASLLAILGHPRTSQLFKPRQPYLTDPLAAEQVPSVRFPQQLLLNPLSTKSAATVVGLVTSQSTSKYELLPPAQPSPSNNKSSASLPRRTFADSPPKSSTSIQAFQLLSKSPLKIQAAFQNNQETSVISTRQSESIQPASSSRMMNSINNNNNQNNSTNSNTHVNSQNQIMHNNNTIVSNNSSSNLIERIFTTQKDDNRIATPDLTKKIKIFARNRHSLFFGLQNKTPTSFADFAVEATPPVKKKHETFISSNSIGNLTFNKSAASLPKRKKNNNNSHLRDLKFDIEQVSAHLSSARITSPTRVIKPNQPPQQPSSDITIDQSQNTLLLNPLNNTTTTPILPSLRQFSSHVSKSATRIDSMPKQQSPQQQSFEAIFFAQRQSLASISGADTASTAEIAFPPKSKSQFNLINQISARNSINNPLRWKLNHPLGSLPTVTVGDSGEQSPQNNQLNSPTNNNSSSKLFILKNQQQQSSTISSSLNNSISALNSSSINRNPKNNNDFNLLSSKKNRQTSLLLLRHAVSNDALSSSRALPPRMSADVGMSDFLQLSKKCTSPKAVVSQFTPSRWGKSQHASGHTQSFRMLPSKKKITSPLNSQVSDYLLRKLQDNEVLRSYIEQSGYTVEMFTFYMMKLYTHCMVADSNIARDFPTLKVSEATLVSVRELFSANMVARQINYSAISEFEDRFNLASKQLMPAAMIEDLGGLESIRRVIVKLLEHLCYESGILSTFDADLIDEAFQASLCLLRSEHTLMKPYLDQLVSTGLISNAEFYHVKIALSKVMKALLFKQNQIHAVTQRIEKNRGYFFALNDFSTDHTFRSLFLASIQKNKHVVGYFLDPSVQTITWFYDIIFQCFFGNTRYVDLIDFLEHRLKTPTIPEILFDDLLETMLQFALPLATGEHEQLLVNKDLRIKIMRAKQKAGILDFKFFRVVGNDINRFITDTLEVYDAIQANQEDEIHETFLKEYFTLVLAEEDQVFSIYDLDYALIFHGIKNFTSSAVIWIDAMNQVLDKYGCEQAAIKSFLSYISLCTMH